MSLVTVVIPAFNEEANIARIAREVLEEPWSDDVTLSKLIIVDDCSDDQTAAAAERLARADTRVCVIRHAQRSGKNAGIRAGIAACTAPIVAILDADITLKRGCVVSTVRLLVDDPSLAASSCVNEPLPARHWRERASRFQASVLAEFYRRGHGSLLRVYALRAAAIRDLILPDTTHDDLYIPRWLDNHGYRYAVSPRAVAYVRPAAGLRDFAKQTVRTWTALEGLERVLPRTVAVPALPHSVTIGAVATVIRRAPWDFLFYAIWRGIVTVTPTSRWLPVVDHSRHDTSTSTKDIELE